MLLTGNERILGGEPLLVRRRQRGGWGSVVGCCADVGAHVGTQWKDRQDPRERREAFLM